MQTHTVFSVDGSLYLQWQADLLAYSHQKVNQPGPLTRLWSANGDPTPFAGRTFQSQPYCPHPVYRDYYPVYNKPSALRTWLQCDPPGEETILLVDPDCVFLAPVKLLVSRGNPIAQSISYMNPAFNSELVMRHCQRPNLVQGMGIPILIHRDDLAQLAPLWLEKTEAIRNDPRSRDLAGWIAEMWAYVFVAAEIGLTHLIHELAVWQMENRADLPIIHYCYSSNDVNNRWSWDKRTYAPRERVPDPPIGTPLATVALIDLLNEWATASEKQVEFILQ